jgi:hypothetical protein
VVLQEIERLQQLSLPATPERVWDNVQTQGKTVFPLSDLVSPIQEAGMRFCMQGVIILVAVKVFQSVIVRLFKPEL